MMYRYFFHIVDVEFDSEYDYTGHFTDHFEAEQFISENEAVGNTVTIVAPYYIEVPASEVDLNAI